MIDFIGVEQLRYSTVPL